MYESLKNLPVMGAVVGDMVGSVYEHSRLKTTDFEMFARGSMFTDDTLMTLAVAYWLIKMHDKESNDRNYQDNVNGLISCMKRIGLSYGQRGFGWHFWQWLNSSDPVPYGSYGNGSAMRVSAVGCIAKTLEETEELAAITAGVSHNHPEGIKGAQAVAAAIFLSRTGKSKQEVKQYIEERFGYDLNRKIEDIRSYYTFDVSCQGSVPESIICWLQSNSYEETIRNAIALGGDADTMAAISGSIAAATMEIPEHHIREAMKRLDGDLISIVNRLAEITKE